jgi:lysophospholipase L1-like esterase
MKILYILILAWFTSNIAYADYVGSELGYPPPERMEKPIINFETKDAQTPPPKGAIVAIGSSSMRGWHNTIQDDLAPLTIIPRGFGGSNMNEALYFADRIVIPYEPRAILLYEGDNDITYKNVSPEDVRNTFKAFVDKVHAALPETRIYVLSIKPSIRRWNFWPDMQTANSLLKAETDKDPRLHYIDIATPMLKEDGTPIPDIFKEDDLHMNSSGYEIWTQTVRPIIMSHEAKFETKTP